MTRHDGVAAAAIARVMAVGAPDIAGVTRDAMLLARDGLRLRADLSALAEALKLERDLRRGAEERVAAVAAEVRAAREEEVEALRGGLADLRAEVDRARAQTAAVQAEAEAARLDSEDRDVRLRAEIRRLAAAAAWVRKQKPSATVRSVAAKANAKARRAIAEVEAAATERTTALGGELNAARAAATDLSAKVAGLRDDLDALRSELEATRGALTEAQERTEVVAAGLRAELAEAQAEVERETKRAERHRVAAKGLQARVDAAARAAEEAQERATAAEARAAAAEERAAPVAAPREARAEQVVAVLQGAGRRGVAAARAMPVDWLSSADPLVESLRGLAGVVLALPQGDIRRARAQLALVSACEGAQALGGVR